MGLNPHWVRYSGGVVPGDGKLSLQDLEPFYAEQVARQVALGSEAIAFRDVMAQLFDAVKPRDRRFITLTDVRRSGMGPLLFSALTNVHKLLAGELADAAAARLAQTTWHPTGCDRWAAHADFLFT